jgi:hypothetical protein
MPYIQQRAGVKTSAAYLGQLTGSLSFQKHSVIGPLSGGLVRGSRAGMKAYNNSQTPQPTEPLGTQPQRQAAMENPVSSAQYVADAKAREAARIKGVTGQSSQGSPSAAAAKNLAGNTATGRFVGQGYKNVKSLTDAGRKAVNHAQRQPNPAPRNTGAPPTPTPPRGGRSYGYQAR